MDNGNKFREIFKTLLDNGKKVSPRGSEVIEIENFGVTFEPFDRFMNFRSRKLNVDYIKREFPTYSWDAFNLAEPRPLKIGKDLYWLLSIIPNDAAGIAKTVLFDAKTNKVTAFDNSESLTTFIKTGTVVPIETKTVQPTTMIDRNVEIKAKLDAVQKELDALKELVK